MKRSICILFSLLVVFSAIELKAQMLEHVYNFNNLTMGELNGQDGWTTVKNINDDGNVSCKDIYIGYGDNSSPDVSYNAYYPCGGPNVGRTASRVSTTDFPFDFTIGGIMEIQVEMFGAWWGTFFGFGYDANNNGYIVPGIEQTAAYQANEGGIGIFLTKRPQNASNNCFMLPDGTKKSFVFDSLYGGWNTYKMVLDLDANGGQGSVSLYAKWTGGSFMPIAEVQNVNLGLTPGSGDKKDPAKWTKLFIQSTGSYGAFDNIIIRQPNVPPGMQYQYITFPAISNHLTTDAPFELGAYSNKGLPITYTIASGPASVSGNILTLTGNPGVVTVVASQPGTEVIMAAKNDTVSFNVIDPLTVFPTVSIRCPINNGKAFTPNLDFVIVSAFIEIENSDVLDIEKVEMRVNGSNLVRAFKTADNYYVGYVNPLSAGNHTVSVKAYSTGGTTKEETLDFNVDLAASTREETIIDHFHFATKPSDGLVCTLDTFINLPSFSGTYSKIMAYLNYECPPGGCEEWDKISNVYIKGTNGETIELLRYITPYGKACSDSLDVTDLASQLQGKIDLIAKFPAKSVITLKLKFIEGTPQYKYSWVNPIWHNYYAFGKYVNQTTAEQTVEPVTVDLNQMQSVKIESAILRLVSSGHGWGNNNSQNALEFRESKNYIRIDGVNVFEQHLWQTCNPNPTGCSPQSGTWQYNRSGWCPGSIPILWQYNLSAYLGKTVNMRYIFDTTYVDFCSSFNPNCVSGTTCPNCTDTYNPFMIVAGDVITFFNTAPEMSIEEHKPFELTVYPNPTSGLMFLNALNNANERKLVRIFNITGNMVMEFEWNSDHTQIDLRDFAKGVYFLNVSSKSGVESRKIVLQ